MSNLLTKTIIFLICKKLGIRRQQAFQFANQKSELEFYWFEDTRLRKFREDGEEEDAHVSLNWLLDDNCEIVMVDPDIL